MNWALLKIWTLSMYEWMTTTSFAFNTKFIMRDKLTASLPLTCFINNKTNPRLFIQDIQSMLIQLTRLPWICHLIFLTFTHYQVKDWIFSVNLQQQQQNNWSSVSNKSLNSRQCQISHQCHSFKNIAYLNRNEYCGQFSVSRHTSNQQCSLLSTNLETCLLKEIVTKTIWRIESTNALRIQSDKFLCSYCSSYDIPSFMSTIHWCVGDKVFGLYFVIFWPICIFFIFSFRLWFKFID